MSTAYSLGACTTDGSTHSLWLWEDGWSRHTTTLSYESYLTGLWQDTVLLYLPDGTDFQASMDNGDTWNTEASAPFTPNYTFCCPGIGPTLVAGESGYFNFYSYIPALRRTLHWSPYYSMPIPDGTGLAISLHISPPNVYYLCQNGAYPSYYKQFYYSNDLGQTWSSPLNLDASYVEMAVSGENIALISRTLTEESYYVGNFWVWDYWPITGHYEDIYQDYNALSVNIRISSDGGETWGSVKNISGAAARNEYAYGTNPYNDGDSETGTDIVAEWYNDNLYIGVATSRFLLATSITGDSFENYLSIDGFEPDGCVANYLVVGGDGVDSLLGYVSVDSTLHTSHPTVKSISNNTHFSILCSSYVGSGSYQDVLSEVCTDGAFVGSALSVENTCLVGDMQYLMTCNPGGGYSFWW